MTALYAELVEDPRIRELVLGRIRAEYERTCRWLLAICEQRRLLDRSPVLQRSVALRNPYVDPLHALQVALLRRGRALERADGPDDQRQAVLSTLLHSINGIAAGVQSFG